MGLFLVLRVAHAYLHPVAVKLPVEFSLTSGLSPLARLNKSNKLLVQWLIVRALTRSSLQKGCLKGALKCRKIVVSFDNALPTLLPPLGFNNTAALMMREEQAARLGLTTISDLKEYVEGKEE